MEHLMTGEISEWEVTSEENSQSRHRDKKKCEI